MRTKKIVIISVLLIILLGILALPAMAAKEKDDTGSAWNIYFRPGVRFGTESRTLYIMDLLVPLYQDDKNIVFTNTKYTPSDRGGWELNRGLGYRRLISGDKLDLILGVNAYYDQRKTDWGTDHKQWGVGLEAMADIPLEPFDLGLTGRFNYYYPLSHTKIDGLGTAYASYVLSDSGIILNGGRVEEPMRGFDYELGMRIPFVSDYVETWAYAGGYNYHGRRVRDINGFMARLEVIPTDFIRLNYEFHHDNYSKAEHYGEISFEVPFSIGNLITGKNPFEGIGDMMTGSRELKERMVEPVRRDVDVKIIVDEDNDNITGTGDQIEDIVFVSETGSDVTGNGTKDNPYATISHALASDTRILAGTCKTIHVMNSSTTAVIDEAAGGGLTLSIADFLLWGSGADHPKYSNIINMPYSGHPTVNDTLELNAANPEVTGLGFDVAGSGYCINILNGSGDSGIKIKNNSFTMSRAGDAYGIYANIASGIGTEDNPIVIANNSFDIESTGRDAGGISLEATGNIFATITGNDMTNAITGGNYAFGIRLSSYNGNVGSAARPVIISGNRMTVKSNTISAYGINLYARNDFFATITGNNMSGGIWGNDRTYGINLYSGTKNIGSEMRPIIVSGNQMTVKADTNEAYGINLVARNDIFATIKGNDMSDGIWGDWVGSGIRLYSDIGSIGSEIRPVIISGNLMIVRTDLNDAYGIRLAAMHDIFATITRNDMSNTITGADDTYGIYLYSSGGNIGSAARPVIISGNLMNVISNVTNAYGIRFYSENFLHCNVIKNVMSVSSNGGFAEGLHARAVNGSILGTFAGNNMKITSLTSYVSGFYLDADDGDYGAANYPMVIKNNRITLEANSGESEGIYFWLDVGAEDVYARILENSITFTNTGTGNILGVHFDADVGNPGNIGFYPNYPVIISGNTAKFYGGNNRFIHLDTLNNNNNNYLIWGGNSLYNTGTWTGNYGPVNEVWHNLTGTDVIRP